MRRSTRIPHWVGGVGYGVFAGEHEYHQGGAIVAMALDLPMLCASDAHTLPEVGISRVRLARDYSTPADFLDALREAEMITHYSSLLANVGSRLAAAAHGLGLGKP